jgi:hypothetical protein
MTHSVRKLTSVSSDDITRLFEDCKSKILEGTLPFEGEPTEADAEVYFSIGIPNALAMPQCEVFGYFKDDYLCFIRYALVTDGVLEQSNYLAGNDAEGSRAYLYSQEFADALKEYYQANFTAVDSWAIAGKSTAVFEEDVLKPNLYETEGITYVKEDLTDPVSNITYEKRTITF